MTLPFDAKPIPVRPDLATALGSFDEAAVLQQLDYWLDRSNNQIDGQSWVYNTAEDWLMHFPWIKSNNTIRRYFNDLKKRGLVVTGNFNRLGFDRTLWYTIDYQRMLAFKEDFYQKIPEDLKRIFTEGLKGPHPAARRKQKQIAKKVTSISPESPNGSPQNCVTNTREYPENKSDNNTETVIPYKKILDYLNEKSGHQFKPNDYNCKFIRARWQEGYRFDDFKKVIDNKCAAWLHVMTRDGRPLAQFLRPSTLFGKKFVRYLEEASAENSDFEPRQRMQNISRARKPDYGIRHEVVTDWAKIYENFNDTIDISDEELREQLRNINPDR